VASESGTSILPMCPMDGRPVCSMRRRRARCSAGISSPISETDRR
jgi:hypothetical protein